MRAIYFSPEKCLWERNGDKVDAILLLDFFQA